MLTPVLVPKIPGMAEILFVIFPGFHVTAIRFVLPCHCEGGLPPVAISRYKLLVKNLVIKIHPAGFCSKIRYVFLLPHLLLICFHSNDFYL